MLADLDVQVRVAATPTQVWDYVTDWTRQGEWIPATKVRTDGDQIIARTALGPIGFDDTMHVRLWEPPHRCETVHTGRLVRGIGIFECRPDGDGTLFVWSERVDIPGGPIAPALWAVARKPVEVGFGYALRRMRDRVEAQHPQSPPG